MDPLRQALHSQLAASPALVARLGDGADGIYHREAPRGATVPMVVFDRVTSFDVHAFRPAGGYETQVWLVKAIDGGTDESETPGRAEDVAVLIDAALKDATPMAGVMWLRRESRIDYPEYDGQTRWHHCGGNYRIATQ